jgi:hypothetical protein
VRVQNHKLGMDLLLSVSRRLSMKICWDLETNLDSSVELIVVTAISSAYSCNTERMREVIVSRCGGNLGRLS